MTRIRKRSSWVAPYLFLSATIPATLSQSLFGGVSFQKLVGSYTDRTYDPNNPAETCFDLMWNADADGDGILQNSEYNTFVGELSEGDFDEANYADLPFVLKVNFVYLSCLCRLRPEIDDVDSDCCEGPGGGIYVSGADPEGITLDWEEDYLREVCSQTQGAIEYAREEAGITVAPTKPPTAQPTNQPSPAPSKQPTAEPTLPPTTSSPTQRPTPAPTTAQPTNQPSPAPSTAQPSPPPTLAPSTAQPSPPPTPSPVTDAPTRQPTSEPSTLAPVAAPVPPPTSKPSAVQVPTSPQPTAVQVPTSSQPTPTSVKPTLAPVAPSIAPSTKAPTPGGTPHPSQSPQPTEVDSGVIPPVPTPPTPDTPTDTPPSPTPDGVGGPGGDGGEEESESLGAGPIVGIVLASAFVGYAAAYLYVKRRKRDIDDPELADVRNKDLDADLEAGRALELGPDSGNERKDDSYDSSLRDANTTSSVHDDDLAADYRIPSAGDSVAVASPSTSPEKLLVTGIPSSPGRGAPKGSDSSSAGESGWSSSAGLSSLNTASFDAGTDDGMMPGSPQRLMAAVGAANIATETAGAVQRDAYPTFLSMESTGSSRSSSYTESTGDQIGSSPLRIHSGPTPEMGEVSRDDLNAAIEAGDWAMVGATAALLATNNNGNDESIGSEPFPRSSGSSIGGSMSDSASELGRAKELDRMVEQGDWEGVVLAAAQFEGRNDQSSEEDTTQYSSKSDKTDESKRKEQIRAEVEVLVRRVVPDEIENIDEMMIQFEGREEELIETLRTMQERNVAQRARAAVQKTAKLEAKAKASISEPPSALGDSNASASSSEPSFFGSANESSLSDHHSDRSASSSVSDLGMTSEDPTQTPYSRQSPTSKRSYQSSLELAIERGDWRAVGEAASMLGDGPSDAALLPDPDESLSGQSLSSALTDPSANKQQRVSHLDELIARGDWAGIVAAAGTYQAMDDLTAGEGTSYPTQEERDALAQAEMWQTIADQSRQEGGLESKEAQDAADWAIARRLEQISSGTGAADVASGDADPDPKRPRVEEDESV